VTRNASHRLARASKALAAAFPEAQIGRLGGARLGAVVLG
jgi:hypothetical protein